jgi:hypothetical protein
MRLYYYQPDMSISFPVRMALTKAGEDWVELTEETLKNYPGKRFYIDARPKSIESRLSDDREMISEMFVDEI